jgi:hypothetical protein
VTAAELFESLGPFVAENLSRLIEREAVVTGGYRGVGGEDTFGSNGVEIILSRVE